MKRKRSMDDTDQPAAKDGWPEELPLQEGKRRANRVPKGAGKKPRPNFFFAVRIDDAEVTGNVTALQQHLITEERRLYTTNVDVRRGAAAESSAAGGSHPTSEQRPTGLARYTVDVSCKLHVTLFVVCAPTPTLLVRTQALCQAWAEDLHARAIPFSPFEMKVHSLRCFNKGRGQFVLWAGLEDPAPLERLARDLHDWFAQHEPSLLQSVKWAPFTPHATILKVRSFGRGQTRGHDSPGERVLRILRPPPQQPNEAKEPVKEGREGEEEEERLEGENIVYRGRPHEEDEEVRKQRPARGRERRGQKKSDQEVIDGGRCFGRQLVDCLELLSMQGTESIDERGRGGYPVYGRLFLDHRPSQYLDRTWSLPLPREMREEEETAVHEAEEWNAWQASVPAEHSGLLYWSVLGRPSQD